MQDIYDLLIIGGGINGAGIARDAAGRGLKVCLVEKDDLAQHTSSASTKLIHGGLRYLEHYEFRLVRESLIERERLLEIAPHLISPRRFVLPHDKGLRPKWMLRLGLFLYDHIGGRKSLPVTTKVDLRSPPHSDILQERLTHGFEYSDCWVDDARLVVLNCLDAQERGADILPSTKCVALERGAQDWLATLQDHSGKKRQVTARQIVNAAGPWVDAVLGKAIPDENHQNLRLVKGSHLIFPRLFEGEHCYIFQHRDGRIIFAIPYELNFTLIGTTDQSFTGDPSQIDISEEEAVYLCEAANEYFRNSLTPDQAVASYAGVRPLYENNAASNSTVTRDYQFELDCGEDGNAPAILSIFGGKITTYRKLAEHALAKLHVGGEVWTRDEALPGGNLAHGDGFDAFCQRMQARYSFLPPEVVTRLARAYGNRILAMLERRASLEEMGEHFGGGLYEVELRYLIAEEWARSGEDVLKRRTKLYLHLSAQEQARVTQWMEENAVPDNSAPNHPTAE